MYQFSSKSKFASFTLNILKFTLLSLEHSSSCRLTNHANERTYYAFYMWRGRERRSTSSIQWSWNVSSVIYIFYSHIVFSILETHPPHNLKNLKSTHIILMMIIIYINHPIYKLLFVCIFVQVLWASSIH